MLVRHPVDLHQQRRHQGIAQDVPAEPGAVRLLEQRFHQTAHLLPLLPGQPKQIGIPRPHGIQMPLQIGIPGRQPAHRSPVNPQDIPLVWLHARGDGHLVQLLGADEQQIPRQHPAEPALDDIGHVSGHQIVDLIEVMVVQLHILQIGILLVLDLKIRRQHLLPRIIIGKLPGHQNPPLSG